MVQKPFQSISTGEELMIKIRNVSANWATEGHQIRSQHLSYILAF